MPKFEVPVRYAGLSNFLVEAASEQEAAAIAERRFKEGATPDMLGNEFERFERVGVIRDQSAPAPMTDEEFAAHRSKCCPYCRQSGKISAELPRWCEVEYWAAESCGHCGKSWVGRYAPVGYHAEHEAVISIRGR